MTIGKRLYYSVCSILVMPAILMICMFVLLLGLFLPLIILVAPEAILKEKFNLGEDNKPIEKE